MYYAYFKAFMSCVVNVLYIEQIPQIKVGKKNNGWFQQEKGQLLWPALEHHIDLLPHFEFAFVVAQLYVLLISTLLFVSHLLLIFNIDPYCTIIELIAGYWK